MNPHTTRRPIHAERARNLVTRLEEMVEPAANFFKHRVADSGLLEIAKIAPGQDLRPSSRVPKNEWAL